MFMQPIDHPVIQRSSQRRIGLKLAVGILAIAAMAPIMALWWMTTLAWLPIAAAGRIVRATARASFDFALFAGEAVVGR
jgi:hypothetical protein